MDQVCQLTPYIDSSPKHRPDKIIVDNGGIGLAMTEQLRSKCRTDSPIIACNITSSLACRKVNDLEYNAGKKFLISGLRQAIDCGWLKVDCQFSDLLKEQLFNFVYKANGKIEGIGSTKDDVLMAATMALLGHIIHTNTVK